MKPTATESRADLHVHSKFSDRPSEWFLRRIGAPESFVDPEDLYFACRKKGMDFVTITDHNSIDGALAIAHLPGTFVSAEITTYFPEDGCKIHCLVYGVTEDDFAAVQAARENIYDLQACLNRRRIVHAIAHPLFRVNDRLDGDHVEKLLLLFDRFEGLNGSRDPRAGRIFRAIADNLSPELVWRMADRHGLAPAHPEPWRKILTGGSDDHSGLYSADAWTATPPARTTADFLAHLREGRHQPGGRGGSSLRLAHSLYRIAYSYYRERLAGQGQGGGLIGELLRKLSDDSSAPAAARKAPPSRLARAFLSFRARRAPAMERTLMNELSDLFGDAARAPKNPDAPADERNFHIASRLGQQLSLGLLRRFIAQVRSGSLLDSLQSLSAIGPVILGLAPYLTAFSSQHKDEGFLRRLAGRFPGAETLRRRSGRRAWITDTFDDVNGVARTIHNLASTAALAGEDLTVVTCRPTVPAVPYPLRNFEPVGTFTLPEYPSQPLSFPPFLDILAYLEREGFDEVILSTPGPMGLCGRAAAKLFGLRASGIYHTDFPQYIRQWTEDDVMADLTWRYMQWFYGDLARVFVPSRCYLDQLRSAGFRSDRLAVLPRGIHTEHFRPDRRQPGFWPDRGLKNGFTFLYVGRVSDEKNLGVLFAAFDRLRGDGVRVDLAVVGDGPALEDWRRRWNRDDIRFAGTLDGDALADAYASADAFVFPSRTDTFGNAVLEAHASGLPAVVSDTGGPAEIVSSHGSGLAVDTRQPDVLAAAMRSLLSDPPLRARLREGALARARDSRWEKVLDLLLEKTSADATPARASGLAPCWPAEPDGEKCDAGILLAM